MRHPVIDWSSGVLFDLAAANKETMERLRRAFAIKGCICSECRAYRPVGRPRKDTWKKS